MPLGFEHVTPVGEESHVGEVNRVCVLCENIAEARHALLPPVLIRVQEFEHVDLGKQAAIRWVAHACIRPGNCGETPEIQASVVGALVAQLRERAQPRQQLLVTGAVHLRYRLAVASFEIGIGKREHARGEKLHDHPDREASFVFVEMVLDDGRVSVVMNHPVDAPQIRIVLVA